jgi:hypothetical protein
MQILFWRVQNNLHRIHFPSITSWQTGAEPKPTGGDDFGLDKKP